MSENSTKIGRKSLKTVQKQDGNTIYPMDFFIASMFQGGLNREGGLIQYRERWYQCFISTRAQSGKGQAHGLQPKMKNKSKLPARE